MPSRATEFSACPSNSMTMSSCQPACRRRQCCTSPGRMVMVGSRTPFTARKRAASSGKSVPKILHRAKLVAHGPRQDEQALLRGSDLGDLGEIAFDDQRAHRAARDLYVGRSMRVWVVPIGPRAIVVMNR